MKNKLFTIVYLIFYVVMLTSCATNSYVSYYGKKVNNIQSITLFSTMIGKIQQPTLPLINAGILNKRTNSIADQIMDLQEKYIDHYRDTVVLCLKKNFKCEVVYGTSLAAKAELKELKEQYDMRNALRTENAYYPYIIIASNDFNPFNFKNGDVIQFFKEPINYGFLISEICKKINTDLLVISYSNLTASTQSVFGPMNNLRLDTYIYLFDKDGYLITDGHAWSLATPLIKENDIKEYKGQLDNFSIILDPMMIKVVRNIQTK